MKLHRSLLTWALAIVPLAAVAITTGDRVAGQESLPKKSYARPEARSGTGGAAAAAGAEPAAAGAEVALPPNELIPESLALLASPDAGAEVVDAGHREVGVAQAWEIVGRANRGRGARIAVLDTGVDVTHPDLAGGKVLDSRNFARDPSAADQQGHGTHCAAVAAAAENGVGVVGVAPDASLLNVKVLGSGGRGAAADIARGVRYAAGDGLPAPRADVICLGFGSPVAHQVIRDAVRFAAGRHVIVVAATGNDGRRQGVSFPAALPECVAVTAFVASDPRPDPITDPRPGFNRRLQSLDLAPFSNGGPEVAVAAPGWFVLGSYPGGRVGELSGTAPATAYVAGVAALYVARKRALGGTPTPSEFRSLIQQTSVSALERPNPNSGWGRVRADAILRLVGHGGDR